MTAVSDIIFVTGFKDIGRTQWNVIPRTTDDYLASYLRVARTIKYRLLTFVEPFIMDLLRSADLPSNIELHNYNDVSTFLSKYFTQDTKLLCSPQYQAAIPGDRKNCPEHCRPGYSLVNHNKVNFIRKTKELYPDYRYYGWIDFGYVRDDTSKFPHNIDTTRLHNKIMYQCTMIPQVRISEREMLAQHIIYIHGSQFIVPNELVESYEKAYGDKLLKWYEIGNTDDDQNLVYQIYFDHPEWFELIKLDVWFTLFKNHLNA